MPGSFGVQIIARRPLQASRLWIYRLFSELVFQESGSRENRALPESYQKPQNRCQGGREDEQSEAEDALDRNLLGVGVEVGTRARTDDEQEQCGESQDRQNVLH